MSLHASRELPHQISCVVAACKLQLAPGRVLSIASRANAKNLHALWPIRAPTFRLRQLERQNPAAPIRTLGLSPRLSDQRRTLRDCTHASCNITSKTVFFQYNFPSPLLCHWPSCHSLLGLTTSHFTCIHSYEPSPLKRNFERLMIGSVWVSHVWHTGIKDH